MRGQTDLVGTGIPACASAGTGRNACATKSAGSAGQGRGERVSSALVGTGEFATVPEVCRAAIREVETVEPDAGRANTYAERHSIYQSLYPALRSFYRSVATM